MAEASPVELPLPHPDRRVAVILNRNAKRVGGRVYRRITEALPEADVFLTESIEQARFVIHRVVDSGYGTIVTGGGDGTIAYTVQQVLDRLEQHPDRPRPRFGILKLGTGNGVADFLGARHYTRDLAELSDAPSTPLDLIRIDGQRICTFAGFGWDAHILDNYEKLKARAQRYLLTRKIFQTAAGYVLAGVGKSFPELVLTKPRWKIRVINTHGVGKRLDPWGQVIARYQPGETAYEGHARLCCFGTTPFFGFKLKIMPFAGQESGMMHMRVIDIDPLTALGHLPQVWRNGRLNHPGVAELKLAGCRIEVDGAAPFQIAGDAAGLRSVVEASISDTIECAHFRR